MSFVAVGVIGGIGASLAGGALGSSAAGDAASAQEDATKYAADLTYKSQKEALDFQKQAYEEQMSLQKPWIEAGKTALGNVAATKDFSYTGSDLASDPGYQFRLAEGNKTLQAKQAQAGRLLGGAAVKQAQRYGQEYASSEFSNAYNRALGTYQTNLNRQLSVAGLGQTGTSAASQAASNYGTNASNITVNTGSTLADLATQRGAATASGYIGSANAWSSALGGIASIAGDTDWGSIFKSNKINPLISG